MNILDMLQVFMPLRPATVDVFFVPHTKNLDSVCPHDEIRVELSSTKPGRSDSSDGGYGGGSSGGLDPKLKNPSPKPNRIGLVSLVVGIVAGFIIRVVAIFADILAFLPEGPFRLAGAATLVGAALGTLVGIKRGSGARAIQSALLFGFLLGVFALAVGWLGSLLPLNTWLGFPLCGAAVMTVVTSIQLFRRRRKEKYYGTSG